MTQSVKKEKILFVINPISGTRHKNDLPDLIKKGIVNAYFEAEIIFTQFKGDATLIVSRKLKEHYRYFVAVGGDGTVNEVGKALIGTSAIMGIIPVGSGNGLARHLKIPLKVSQAIATINQMKYHSIDYGLINDQPFFCTCGVGFDALIGDKFAQCKGRGLSNYVKTTVREYFKYQPETYELMLDQGVKIFVPAFLITFANASQYGNNAYISPNADITDGKLDLCILSPFKLYSALIIGFRLFAKTMNKSSLMQIRQAKTILLKRKEKGVIHFDGEPCSMEKELNISIINKGLNIIIP